MLRSAESLKGYGLEASDGKIGRCRDFLFDDEQWTIRYLVADTGTWLPRKKVLISPISLGEPDWPSGMLPVNLTREEIEGAPDLDEDAPVSRQYEASWFRHFRFPYYWNGTGIWGFGVEPGSLSAGRQQVATQVLEEESSGGDSHLRSLHEVTGYHIQATDDEIGHVEDWILDERSWVLRYVVIDTRNWLPGRKVLVAPEWIRSIDARSRKTVVDLDRDTIRSSPEYDPSVPVNREYETRLYDYYGRPGYWV